MKKVIIFTWSYCPYCVKAKILLDSENIVYTEKVIDGDQEAKKMLTKKSGSSTVPQIFVDDVFIGGCDELHQLHKNRKQFNDQFDIEPE